MESCSGILNIKPISSLMKCKYYGESLSWNTERMGAKGGSDSLFQVFTFRLRRLWETSAWRQTEKVNAEMQERDGSPEVPQLSLKGDKTPEMKASNETTCSTKCVIACLCMPLCVCVW